MKGNQWRYPNEPNMWQKWVITQPSLRLWILDLKKRGIFVICEWLNIDETKESLEEVIQFMDENKFSFLILGKTMRHPNTIDINGISIGFMEVLQSKNKRENGNSKIKGANVWVRYGTHATWNNLILNRR